MMLCVGGRDRSGTKPAACSLSAETLGIIPVIAYHRHRNSLANKPKGGGHDHS